MATQAMEKQLTEELSARDIRLIREGWALKKEIEDKQAQLEAVNQQLLKTHGVGSLIVPGECRVIISERQTLEISDAGQLRAVLGARFDDLVKTEIKYKPEQKLKDMTVDGDDPQRDAIAGCMTVKSSQSVSWRAEK